MALLGYARVSTQGQDLTAQIEALKAAGAETIYKEKVSGVRADRPQLAKLMARLMPGDILAVTKLDRLGRSTRELLELIERIGKAGAAFRSLGDPLWDTTSSRGRLLSTLLAAIADFERDLIRERTGEGRKRAMANGVKFGRKRKLSEYQRAEAIKRRADRGNARVDRQELRRGDLDDFEAVIVSRRTPTCCATPAASSWPMTESIPGRCRPTSGTAISRIRPARGVGAV